MGAFLVVSVQLPAACSLFLLSQVSIRTTSIAVPVMTILQLAMLMITKC